MSTVFEVYPSKDVIPTFRDILVRANGHLDNFLGSYEIALSVTLSVTLRESPREDDREVPIDLDGPAWWERPQYAWFYVLGAPGGTDVCARKWDDFEKQVAVEEFSGDKGAGIADLLAKSLEIRRSWHFRLSWGQPSIVTIAYGLIAASLAELTEGFIHSSDGAWDYEVLPARPSDFLRWYFRPELAKRSDDADWAVRCIRSLKRISKKVMEKEKYLPEE